MTSRTQQKLPSPHPGFPRAAPSISTSSAGTEAVAPGTFSDEFSGFRVVDTRKCNRTVRIQHLPTSAALADLVEKQQHINKNDIEISSPIAMISSAYPSDGSGISSLGGVASPQVQSRSNSNKTHAEFPSSPDNLNLVDFDCSISSRSSSPSSEEEEDQQTAMLAGPTVATQLKGLLSFRSDLDKSQQRQKLTEHKEQMQTEWLKLQENTVAATGGTAKGWTKLQQSISLCYLVAETHRYQLMKKAAAATRAATAARVAAAQARAANAGKNNKGLIITTTTTPAPAQVPRNTAAARNLDFSKPETAALLISDVVVLVGEAEEGVDRYDRIRQQLSTLALWW